MSRSCFFFHVKSNHAVYKKKNVYMLLVVCCSIRKLQFFFFFFFLVGFFFSGSFFFRKKSNTYIHPSIHLSHDPYNNLLLVMYITFGYNEKEGVLSFMKNWIILSPCCPALLSGPSNYIAIWGLKGGEDFEPEKSPQSLFFSSIIHWLFLPAWNTPFHFLITYG